MARVEPPNSQILTTVSELGVVHEVAFRIRNIRVPASQRSAPDRPRSFQAVVQLGTLSCDRCRAPSSGHKYFQNITT